jgi:4-amino-4-deoxy-L-arabinose transferase-like glycosyltransferase
LTRRLEESIWLAPGILLIVCALLFFYGLNAGELYRNESLRAIIAAEFLRSGNWIVPMLYGEPLYTKPPGMYAAIALVSWPFGAVHEWTARLPSALAATITVFLVYRLFRRHCGRRAGLVAGLLLPMNLMWLDKATAAEIDMLQVAWVTGAICCFLRALEIAEASPAGCPVTIVGFRVGVDPDSNNWQDLPDIAAKRLSDPHEPVAGRGSSQWLWWCAALACVAGGVLTKWTAPVFFYSMVLPLLWWRGQLRLLLGRHHVAGVLLGVSLCIAWIGAAIALSGWQTFHGTVSREALQRLLPSGQGHGYYWRETLLHPLKLLATTLPWSAVALLALWPRFFESSDPRHERLRQAFHCWVWPNMLFWSLFPQHAVRHSFPLFPGIACLTALVFTECLRVPERFHLRIKPWPILVGCLVVWLAVKVCFVEWVTPVRNGQRAPRARAEQIAALVPEGKTLYLFRLKDEGIMFYYGRTVRRLPGPARLPSGGELLYCILDRVDWRDWPAGRETEILREMTDEQGDPMVLVRVK